MDRWFSYFFERFNPIFTLVVISGISTSATIFNDNLFDPIVFMASSMVWFFMSYYFRLHNDLEDLQVDKVAHPDRPLPREIIQPQEAQIVLKATLLILVFLGVGIFLYFDAWSRLLVLINGGYFWLIRQNFYMGKSLDRKPLLKTILYQGILLPMTLLSISFSHPQTLFSTQSLSYCVLLYGVFFTFELCRKLNPFSHPASQSLIHFFGFKKVFRYAFVSLTVSAVGAFGFGAASFLLPVQLGVFLSLVYLFKNPRRYTISQLAASFSLILHSWSGVFERIGFISQTW